MWDEIFADYMKTKPNVLLGGSGGPSERALESKKTVLLDGVKARALAAKAAGYTDVQNRKEMNEYDATTDVRLLGMFGSRSLPYEYEAILGTDKGYDTQDFVGELRSLNVVPHVASKARGSAIDGRTTSHAGYAKSITARRGTRGCLGCT
jgi:hypothetical protein